MTAPRKRRGNPPESPWRSTPNSDRASPAHRVTLRRERWEQVRAAAKADADLDGNVSGLIERALDAFLGPPKKST